MKLPAVAFTTAFALGIACGLTKTSENVAGSHVFVGLIYAGAAASLLTGFLLSHFEKVMAAGLASLVCWTLLGWAGACLGHQPRKIDHIVSLASAGKINLKTPLRYFGRLRDEPEKLPWGFRYDIELSAVDAEGTRMPVAGGLRVSFARPEKELAEPTVLHAGDSVAVLTQAKLPPFYRDEGAFDRRAYLAEHDVDVVATLRAPELLLLMEPARLSFSGLVARARRRLREEVDELWGVDTKVAGVVRAMLLGDRNFVDGEEAKDFQKTGAFHVLVVAGLHVGAIAVVLFWAGRKLRVARVYSVILTLVVLLAYVTVVEQREPVLRAALMAGIVLVGGAFFRRLELLNSAALAALILLVARPLALRDSSFQLSFLAMGCIAGWAIPWLERTVQPYARALRGWRDVTRDIAHEPKPTQFRIDLRSLTHMMEARLPKRMATLPGTAISCGLRFSIRVWELFVLTLVLQMGMMPLLASEFHRITFAGPLVNFAAVPLTAVIVPLGFFTIISGLLFPVLGKALAPALSWVVLALVHVVQRFAEVQKFSYRIPAPPLWVVVIFLVALTGIVVCYRVELSRGRTISRFFMATLAVSAAIIATFPFAARHAAGALEVSILDVGQGDSLFVVSPGGKTLLIDGGGAFAGFPGQVQARGSDPGEEAVSPYLWSRGFKKIDVVALTHAHQDHLGGLSAILENFRVEQLWIGREVKSAALAKLESLAREKHIPIEYESRGKSFALDGVEGQFLWPTLSEDSGVAAKNNDSLVLRLKFRDRTLLLPGDAEKQAEQAILAENSEEELHADVLKVGHHGSKNSTTEEFLRAVRPRIAIISAGEDNPYGHPSLELLERLETSGARVLRTDRDGAVQVVTDGEQLKVSCFVECPEAATAKIGRASCRERV